MKLNTKIILFFLITYVVGLPVYAENEMPLLSSPTTVCNIVYGQSAGDIDNANDIVVRKAQLERLISGKILVQDSERVCGVDNKNVSKIREQYYLVSSNVKTLLEKDKDIIDSHKLKTFIDTRLYEISDVLYTVDDYVNDLESSMRFKKKDYIDKVENQRRAKLYKVELESMLDDWEDLKDFVNKIYSNESGAGIFLAPVKYL